MKAFWRHIPELQRLTRGKPGKVPQGKPRVTDGTLAGIRRETPKQIIQQMPSGRVIVVGDDDLEQQVNATLTDIILPNANSGGTPYAKSKRAIRDTTDVGSAWAVCFFDRTGSLLHANYKIKYYKDVLFEKGKVSEFDMNFLPVIDWYTKTDLQAIIWQTTQLQQSAKDRKEDFEAEWDPKALQELIDSGESEKDADQKSPQEQNKDATVCYYKVVTFYQRGVGATFFKYAPKIQKVVGKCVSKDPRGIIPVHGLVPEESDINPLGEPLAAISAGKQNLLDFDMQMYQYGQGLLYSPPVKKWGSTSKTKIKLVPDAVIEMNGTKASDDFETVTIGNEATANYANNYSLIKSQILNETGRMDDTSIPSTAGNVGFSKTPQGVKTQAARTSASDNDLRLSYELWQGRINETLLNLHFAHSQGNKELELDPNTLKRMKLDKNPVMDFSKDYGPIKFKVTASSSQKLSDADQVANMQAAQTLMTPQNVYYLGQDGWKLDIGSYNRNMLQRMNIDSVDEILTKMDDQEAAQAKKQPFPIIDPPQFRINSADIPKEAWPGILQNGGVNLPPNTPLTKDAPIDLGDIFKDPSTTVQEKAQMKVLAGIQPDPNAQNPEATPQGPNPDEVAMKQQEIGIKQQQVDQKNAELALQAHKQVHDQNIAEQKLANEQHKTTVDTGMKLHKQSQDSALQLDNHVHSQQLANQQAANPQEPTNA